MAMFRRSPNPVVGDVVASALAGGGIGGVQDYGAPDHVGSSALVAAADWVRLLLTGSVGVTLATIAIAAVGYMMLAGRIHARRTGQIILGCFILFSAQAIAAGLAELNQQAREETVAGSPALAEPAYQPSVPKVEQKDPFAGAAAPPAERQDWE